MTQFVYRSFIDAPAEAVFDWHARPGAFERLQPPWENIRVLERKGTIRDGDRLVIETRVGPLKMRWVAEHCDYRYGRQFRDVQIRGPFARWEHTHRFEPEGSGCILEDRIEFELPGGKLSSWLGKAFTIKKLDRMFRYRHATTNHDLQAHHGNKGGKMKILVSGATGLIGSALTPFLTTGGHEVFRLVRATPTGDTDIQWDPYSESVDVEQLEGFDAVVHLSGENIAGRWTASKKDAIRKSRITTTRFLSQTLSTLKHPPKVLVCSSAIGYYGDRGDEVMTEKNTFGKGFLTEVTREWEAATAPASVKGIRVVNLRTGVVLAADGGALEKMLTPFKLGAGGVVGDGKQYWSWIALDDVVGAIHHCIMNESLKNAVNAVAPNPVTNAEFTKTLGKVLNRPALVPLPAFAARIALGEMADALLLASTRVDPAKLKESGYEFRFPELHPALEHIFGN